MDANIVWGSYRDEITFLGFCLSFVWFCLKVAFFPRGVLPKMAGAHGLLIMAYTGRFYPKGVPFSGFSNMNGWRFH